MGKCKYWEKIKDDPVKVEQYRERKRKNHNAIKHNPETILKQKARDKNYRTKVQNDDELRIKRNLDTATRRKKRMLDPKSRMKETETKRVYKKRKLKEDPILRIKENLRRRLNTFVKTKSDDIKINDFNTYTGCLPSELRDHLEKQFVDGMSFENYGKWEIDHIIPLASATTKEELLKLCHYTNLQPLWSLPNKIKGKKMPE